MVAASLKRHCHAASFVSTLHFRRSENQIGKSNLAHQVVEPIRKVLIILSLQLLQFGCMVSAYAHINDTVFVSYRIDLMLNWERFAVYSKGFNICFFHPMPILRSTPIWWEAPRSDNDVTFWVDTGFDHSHEIESVSCHFQSVFVSKRKNGMEHIGLAGSRASRRLIRYETKTVSCKQKVNMTCSQSDMKWKQYLVNTRPYAKFCCKNYRNCNVSTEGHEWQWLSSLRLRGCDVSRNVYRNWESYVNLSAFVNLALLFRDPCRKKYLIGTGFQSMKFILFIWILHYVDMVTDRWPWLLCFTVQNDLIMTLWSAETYIMTLKSDPF